MQKLAAINTGSTGSSTLSPIQVPSLKVSSSFDISSDLTQAVASPIKAASTRAVITFMTGGISILVNFPAMLSVYWHHRLYAEKESHCNLRLLRKRGSDR